MNNDKCIIANVKWEDRGILLGIMYHILKKYKKLKYEEIYIREDKYRAFCTFIFKELDFTKEKDGEQYIISIKSIEDGDLNINNLNNLRNITTKKYHLLPWYDKDNPIIMFTNGKQNKSINSIREEIDDITCIRGKPSKIRNQITDVCYNIWDTRIEYYILGKYYKKFGISVDYLYNLLTNYLMSDMCMRDRMIPYPVSFYQRVEVPTYIPIPIEKTNNQHIEPVDKQNIEPVNKQNIEKTINTIQVIGKQDIVKTDVNKDIGHFNLFMDVINKISDKISTVNKIIDSK
jgi:hypothetical protein